MQDAPSRPALEAEKEKLAKLRTVRQGIAQEINGLADKLPKAGKGESGGSTMLGRILSEGDAALGKSETKTLEALGDEQRKLQVVDAELSNQEKIVRELHRKFSVEVNRAMWPTRKPVAERIGKALKELQAALDADIQLRADIAKHGVDLNAMDHFATVPLMCAEHWLDRARKWGFKV